MTHKCSFIEAFYGQHGSTWLRPQINSVTLMQVSYLPEHSSTVTNAIHELDSAVYARLWQNNYPAIHMLVMVNILNTATWPFRAVSPCGQKVMEVKSYPKSLVLQSKWVSSGSLFYVQSQWSCPKSWTHCEAVALSMVSKLESHKCGSHLRPYAGGHKHFHLLPHINTHTGKEFRSIQMWYSDGQ